MEHVLDHVFIKLGMNGVEGGIDMPVVMTEAVANLPYSRKSEYISTFPPFPQALTL
jgi:actin-related protein 5